MRQDEAELLVDTMLDWVRDQIDGPIKRNKLKCVVVLCKTCENEESGFVIGTTAFGLSPKVQALLLAQVLEDMSKDVEGIEVTISDGFHE